jgi:pimeloyl-ACP methyl ester carboxylesterase
MITELVHVRIKLALHTLREAEGPQLLLLHGLGERSPSAVQQNIETWPGAIYALDFTGHGASTIPAGGGYTTEGLMGDVAIALDHLGPTTLLGRGLGAYVGLLAAGALPTKVRGAILADGPGLAGGGPAPTSPHILVVDPASVAPPDPFALAELVDDVRPPDYATSFARQATQLSGLPDPVAVTAMARPDWLKAVVDEPGVVVTTLSDALSLYGANAST